MEIGLRHQQCYWIAWAEICLLVGLYYLFVWVVPHSYFSEDFPRKLLFIFVIAAGYYFIYLSPKIHRDSLEERGFGEMKNFFIKTDSFKKDSTAYGSFAFCCGIGLLVAIVEKHIRTGIMVDWSAYFLKYGLYFFSATIQDILFFSLLFLRIKSLIRHHITTEKEYPRQLLASFLLAVSFGLAHAPNWPLLSFTFVFAFGLAWIFYQRPNLFLVVMCHAFFGATLHRIYQLHMKFGIFYGQYEAKASFFRKVIPGLEMIIGNRW